MQNLAAFLRAHRLHLNTDLGQHFLQNEDVLQTIVDAAQITKGDRIVEIGPGIGVLTRELLARGARVEAIELDARLIPLLKEYTGNPKELTIIEGNALHTPLPEEPYSIVANIPYHITSPLLRHAFMEAAVPPRSMTLLIQREVAEKICSTKDASMLGILVRLFGEPELICTVEPEAFLPPPKVDSAVLHIQCFPEPLATSEVLQEVFRLTGIAFSQRRKMLRNTLGTLPNGMELLKHADIAADRRPQTLSVEEWICLATTP